MSKENKETGNIKEMIVMNELENGVVSISIERPEAYNALNEEVVLELAGIIKHIKTLPNIRVVIFKSGKHFAAGGDIKEMVHFGKKEAKDYSFSPTFNMVANLEVPTIASLRGYALGGGLELALACDFRIAAMDAKMSFPEINIGIMPGAGGMLRAPSIIGVAKTKELAMMGTVIDGIEAERIGLVNKSVPSEDLDFETLKWANVISSKAPVATKMIKKTIMECFEEPNISKAYEMECENWSDLFLTNDQKEGMNSFIEKRQPIYSGK